MKRFLIVAVLALGLMSMTGDKARAMGCCGPGHFSISLNFSWGGGGCNSCPPPPCCYGPPAAYNGYPGGGFGGYPSFDGGYSAPIGYGGY
jgi:hypothetical protein